MVLIFAPIFSFSATLPSGYTELEYIENSRGQYIDTGFKLTSSYTRFDFYVKCSVDRGTNSGDLNNEKNIFSNDGCVFGFVQTPTRTVIATKSGTDSWNIKHGTISSDIDIIEASGYFVSNKFMDNFTTNPVYEVDSGINRPYENNKNFYLLKGRTNTNRPYAGKLYRLTFVVDNVAQRDFIPARRDSDNVIGLYDIVNNVFYTNSGTGSFVAGPAVSSCGYTELEYLELQGEAYFNTNVYLSKDMDIEFEFMPTKLDTTGVLALNRNVAYGGLQVAYNINNVIDPQYIINDTLVDFFGTTSSDRWTIKNNNSNYILENNKKYKLSIVNKVGSFYKNGTQLETYTYTAPGESPMTTPLYINAISFQNGQSIAPTYINGNLHIRFYHFSATGVADIVPVKRDCDNVLGLYNKTTGEFLEKIGSGTLVAGPELSQTIAIHWGGLTEPDASGTCTYGETFTAPSTAPTAPSGLKFLGWRPM